MTCERGRRTRTSPTCCGLTTILTVSHTDNAVRAPITGPTLFNVMLSRWSLTVVTGSLSLRFTSTTRPIHRFSRCLPRRKPPASRCTASSGMLTQTICPMFTVPRVRRVICKRTHRSVCLPKIEAGHPPSCVSDVMCVATTRPPHVFRS